MIKDTFTRTRIRPSAYIIETVKLTMKTKIMRAVLARTYRQNITLHLNLYYFQISSNLVGRDTFLITLNNHNYL